MGSMVVVGAKRTVSVGDQLGQWELSQQDSRGKVGAEVYTGMKGSKVSRERVQHRLPRGPTPRGI